MLGVSADDADSHERFAAKYRLPFTLLSDPDRQRHAAYGAYGEKTMYGRKVVGVIRSTVWIGPDGRGAPALGAGGQRGRAPEQGAGGAPRGE